MKRRIQEKYQVSYFDRDFYYDGSLLYDHTPLRNIGLKEDSIIFIGASKAVCHVLGRGSRSIGIAKWGALWNERIEFAGCSKSINTMNLAWQCDRLLLISA